MSTRPGMSIEQVQRWVVTALVCAVSSFPLGALIMVTHRIHRHDPGGAVVLCVMTAVIGIFTVAAARLVHRRTPWSPLLVVGALPAAGSMVWTWSD